MQHPYLLHQQQKALNIAHNVDDIAVMGKFCCGSCKIIFIARRKLDGLYTSGTAFGSILSFVLPRSMHHFLTLFANSWCHAVHAKVKLQTLAMACSADQSAATSGSTRVSQQTMCVSTCKDNTTACCAYQRPTHLQSCMML